MLIGKPAEKRPLGRPRCKWEDNIKMDLKEMGINTRSWVDSAHGKDNWTTTVNPDSISYGVSYSVNEIVYEEPVSLIILNFTTDKVIETFRNTTYHLVPRTR